MRDKIIIEDLYKVFGPEPDQALDALKDGKDKEAIYAETQHTVGVQGANLRIREGEVFVVMGLSGSGKSTLLRMLNRLIEPTRGRVLVNGEDVTQMNHDDLIRLRRKEMAMVFQSFALMPHRTVLENAAFALDVAGLPRAEQKRRAREALETVGLGAYGDSYPDELSGGMQQRVGLARALATRPSILLMDEAFSALDPLIRTEMQDELLKLQRENARTVVFISHDLDEAIRIGDRIAIMEGGAIVQVGTPQEIIEQPANDFVRSFFYGVDVSKVFRAQDIAVYDEGQADKEGNPRAGTKTVSSDMPLNEVLHHVAHNEQPVAVVDESGRYLGSIDKGRLLLTMDKAKP
jgi:glycine betaine/proline transport system ATP-binding protein